MRTFIAVPLPSECRETLEKIQRPMRSLGADVRWTSIASIHLTLKFLLKHAITCRSTRITAGCILEIGGESRGGIRLILE